MPRSRRPRTSWVVAALAALPLAATACGEKRPPSNPPAATCIVGQSPVNECVIR